MSLTRTAPIITAGTDVSAADHRALLLAFDELLEARFSGHTWLAYTVNPQLPVDNVCLFGTASNINAGPYTAYDPANEDPPDPPMGNVLATDATRKVIWLTGYSDTTTLNRRTVDYDPGTGMETWWVATFRPQRFEPLGIADIIVENYTDPVAGVTTTFTYRSYWDKYGCIRIHNGNRFALTVNFGGASQSPIVIPPYGVICGRRPNHDQPFVFESKYIHLTQEGDPIRWHKWIGEDFEGALFAGSFEFLDIQLQSLYEWVRFAPDIDYDSTSVEQGTFTGSTPTNSDNLWDWLWHRGKLLSVVLDRRDGTTTVTELTWNGIGSIPNATWSGHVDLTLDDTFITQTFESAITPPSGAADDEWNHDLIPISTNLTGGVVLSLHPDPAVLSPGAVKWEHYTDPTGVIGSLAVTGTTGYYTTPSGSTTTHNVVTRAMQGVTLGLDDFSTTLTNAIPIPPSGSNTLQKVGCAIGRRNVSTSSAGFGMSWFPAGTLLTAHTDGSLLEWVTFYHKTLSGRLRFTARQSRRYHNANASYDNHPQDKDVLGTTDGLGGPMTVRVEPVKISPIAIEGVAWNRTATLRGSVMLTPSDQRHAVATRINEPGWWAANRDRIMAGTFDSADESIAWRPPRLIEQFNSMARAINAVQEVYPANIYHLFKDPLPSGCNEFPFTYPGENPFAVPADWCCGRHDGDDALKDWADLWGVTYTLGLADVDALAAIDRRDWATKGNGSNEVVELSKVLTSDHDPVNSPSTVNGHTFYKYQFFDAATSRRLFGGAGEWSDYAWVSHTDMESVFGPLGVAIPPVPAGERFTPTIEEDTSATAINGGLASGSAVGSYSYRAPAQTGYRLPSSSGTWIQVFHGGLGGDYQMRVNAQFRLLSVGTTAAPIFSWLNTGDTQFNTFRRDRSVDCNDNSRLSPRDKTLLTSAATHETYSMYEAIDSSAWRSGVEVYSSTPILLIAAPEPWCEFVWNITSFDATGTPLVLVESQYNINVYTPPSATGLNHDEFASGSRNVNALISAGWSTFLAYHCQITQRYGVTRA